MTAFRAVRSAEGKFAQVANAALQDRRLSFKARGVIGFVISMPPDAQLSAAWLEDQGPDGREAIRSALRELEKCGYYRRTRKSAGKGAWTWEQILSDAPVFAQVSSSAGFTQVNNPSDETPSDETPSDKRQTREPPKDVGAKDKKSNTVAPKARPGPEAMVSRRARTSGASDRVLTSQDKIDGTRFAIAAVYGESWNKSISDEDALALFTLKAPRSGKVTSVTAYMTKIFGDTPAFDTLLSRLDTGLDGDGDDYAQGHDVQSYPPCPRCGGMRAEIDPDRQVCALCARELIINGTATDPAGWNVTILDAVRTALFVTTGKSPDDAWCARVAGHILSGRDFKQRGAGPKVKYVTTTIGNDPNPSRFLPTPTPARVA